MTIFFLISRAGSHRTARYLVFSLLGVFIQSAQRCCVSLKRLSCAHRETESSIDFCDRFGVVRCQSVAPARPSLSILLFLSGVLSLCPVFRSFCSSSHLLSSPPPPSVCVCVCGCFFDSQLTLFFRSLPINPGHACRFHLFLYLCLPWVITSKQLPTHGRRIPHI